MRPRGDLPLPHGHGERLERDVLIGLTTHGPADDSAGVQVQKHREVEPPRPSRDGRHLGELIPTPFCDQLPLRGNEKPSRSCSLRL